MILVNEINQSKKYVIILEMIKQENYMKFNKLFKEMLYFIIQIKELNEQNSDNQNLRDYYIIKGTIELKIQNLIEKDSQYESKILIDQKINSVDKQLNQKVNWIELQFKDEYIFLIHSTSDWIQNFKSSAFMSSLLRQRCYKIKEGSFIFERRKSQSTK
ncbi:unnamed protein product [Paramecium pentaurelia]|uniref:Uncharacterized protein n=1 Tax=Paramecium pentaurelia TaxID=43138 RepID=A0A8S1TW49_9CILI|nr:unnamed protein product [Paramecium pentaurelia]